MHSEAQYRMEPDVFIELEIGVQRIMPFINENADDLSFAVTPIAANHCPGAVCYLFEGYFGRFLCTGDFRYKRGLFDGHNVIDVDRLYLDDTYCSPRFNRFLTTSECASEIGRIIGLEENRHCRFMIAVDTLGKEDVFIALSSLLDTLIVVNPDRYKRLQSLLDHENVARYFTTDVENGYILMVNKREISLRNLDRLNEKLLKSQLTRTQFVGILPSGWSIGKNPKKTSAAGSRLYTVTYSAHSSFEELCDAVQYIKPRSIIPIVADHGSRAPGCFTQFMSLEKPKYFAIPPLIQGILNGKRNMATIAVQHLSKNNRVITRKTGKRKVVSSLVGTRKKVKGFRFQNVKSSNSSKSLESSKSPNIVSDEDLENVSAPKRHEIIDLLTPPKRDRTPYIKPKSDWTMENDDKFMSADILTQDVDLVLTPIDTNQSVIVRNSINDREDDHKKEDSVDSNASIVSEPMASTNPTPSQCLRSRSARKRKRSSLEQDSGSEIGMSMISDLRAMSPESMFKPRTKRKRRLVPVDTQFGDEDGVYHWGDVGDGDEWKEMIGGAEGEGEGVMEMKVRSALMSAKKRKKKKKRRISSVGLDEEDFSGVEASQILDDIPTLSVCGIPDDGEWQNGNQFVATLSGTDGEDSDFEDENLLNDVCTQLFDDGLSTEDNEVDDAVSVSDGDEEESDEFVTQRSRLKKRSALDMQDT